MINFLRYARDPGRHRRIKPTLLILWVLFLAGLALGSDYGALPARDWNPSQLAKIKVAQPDILTFAVMGDSRNSREVFEGLLKQINQDRDMAFSIHLGDLVQDGKLEQYRFFLGQVRKNLQKPLLTVIGNHELHNKGRQLYHDIFGPYYYSFHLQNNYFIVVDDAGKTSLNEAQLGWLAEELKKAQAFPRRFVFLHIPLFDPRGDEHYHGVPEEIRRRLKDLFQQYKVTHIFAGHIHGYFAEKWAGVPYTITGGAGAEIKGTDPQHYFFHYLEVSIKGDDVRIEVRRVPFAK